MKAERISLGNSIQACLHVKEAGAKLRLRKATEQQVSSSKESRRHQRKGLPHSTALTRIEGPNGQVCLVYLENCYISMTLLIYSWHDSLCPFLCSLKFLTLTSYAWEGIYREVTMTPSFGPFVLCIYNFSLQINILPF